jgi:hypothetical protein
MSSDLPDQDSSEVKVELDRLLEVGRLLASVLTPEEIATVQMFMGVSSNKNDKDSKHPSIVEIGNSSVT